MKFEWKDNAKEKPVNPKSPLTRKDYLVCVKYYAGKYGYQTMEWADGWNCSMDFNGEIDRTHEIKNIVAWAEIPEYTGGEND